MASDGDGVDAHLYDGVIVATGLSHVAKVQYIFFGDIQFFQKVGHAEFFVHTRGDGIDRGGAANFVVKFGGVFFAFCHDFFAFFAVWIPGVLFFGAGFLAEGGESDLGEAVFDNFVAGL